MVSIVPATSASGRHAHRGVMRTRARAGRRVGEPHVVARRVRVLTAARATRQRRRRVTRDDTLTLLAAGGDRDHVARPELPRLSASSVTVASPTACATARAGGLKQRVFAGGQQVLLGDRRP